MQTHVINSSLHQCDALLALRLSWGTQIDFCQMKRARSVGQWVSCGAADDDKYIREWSAAHTPLSCTQQQQEQGQLITSLTMMWTCMPDENNKTMCVSKNPQQSCLGRRHIRGYRLRFSHHRNDWVLLIGALQTVCARGDALNSMVGL